MRANRYVTAVLAAGLLSGGLRAACQAGQVELGDWVVKTVVRPDSIAGHNLTWTERLPVGDLGGDGRMDLLFAGHSQYVQALHWADGWAGTPRETSVPTLSLFFASGWEQPYSTLLRRPGGVSLVALAPNYRHRFFDVRTGQLLGEVPWPAPPGPGLPPTNGFASVVRAGDVDGDGWEDAFCQVTNGNYAVAGCIDGRTMTVTWQRYLPDQGGLSPAMPLSLEGWPDVDADGKPDMIFTTPRYHAASGTWAATAEALDGESGAVHWSTTVPGLGWYATGAVGPDLNGDGVAEFALVVGAAGDVHCLDGASGTVLWSQNVSAAAPLMPPTYTVRELEFTVAFSESPLVADTEVVAKTFAVEPVTGASVRGLLHLDAQTGAVNRYWDGFTGTLAPWLPDPVQFDNRLASMIGDIDGDGIVDMGVNNETPSLYNSALPGPSAAQVVWSMATLRVPATLSIGQTMTWDVAIPSAGGMQVVLLLSEVFDGSGGVAVGDWPTQLGLDPALLWSARGNGGAPALTTSLAPDGSGSMTAQIPASAALVGRTYYSKAIVPGPAGSADILTSSNLGITMLLP